MEGSSLSMSDHLIPKRDGSTLIIPAMLAWTIVVFIVGLAFVSGVRLAEIQSVQRENTRLVAEVKSAADRDVAALRAYVNEQDASIRMNVQDRSTSFHDTINNHRRTIEALHAVDLDRTKQIHELEMRMQAIELQNRRQTSNATGNSR